MYGRMSDEHWVGTHQLNPESISTSALATAGEMSPHAERSATLQVKRSIKNLPRTYGKPLPTLLCPR